MDEFELINRFFRPLCVDVAENDIGIGDDASVLTAPNKQQLVVTTDTHVESVHFPAGAKPYDVGFRSCTTSLSDIAAMGATARWASLALTVPDANDGWFEGFAGGAAAALKQCEASLIGGDTTRGPLVITWNIIGTVSPGTALLRSGALPGDGIYVSGTLGSSAAALTFPLTGAHSYKGFQAKLRDRYWYPQPRFDMARRLRSVASACIDISDGLIADLTHLARSSNCGAVIDSVQVPMDSILIELVGIERGLQMALTGGDDYELCFTVAQENEMELMRLGKKLDLCITRIGSMVEGSGVRVIGESDLEITINRTGYRHFE